MEVLASLYRTTGKRKNRMRTPLRQGAALSEVCDVRASRARMGRLHLCYPRCRRVPGPDRLGDQMAVPPLRSDGEAPTTASPSDALSAASADEGRIPAFSDA